MAVLKLPISATKSQLVQAINGLVDELAVAPQRTYPIGTVYTFDGASTNPATTLGFGEWTLQSTVGTTYTWKRTK